MLKTFLHQHNLDKEEELIFFGGCFNPWHEGHSSCIKLMPEDKKIIVIPDHSPFKELTVSKQKHSSLDDIQKHLNSFEQQTYLFDGFFKADKQNPTYYWINELKNQYPNTKLSLLMGFDTFITIDKWTEAKELLKLLDTLYVASRLDDNAIKDKQEKLLQELNPYLKIDFLGNHPFEDLSSSKLRTNN
jgi:nicotinate-nucleotide adenylyltransferase